MVLTTDIPLEIPRVHPSLRPLGAFEELLWQMDRRSQLHATLAAHIDGSTTIKQWRIALEQTRCRHPLWSATIDAVSADVPFFREMHDAEVPLRVVECDSIDGWEDEISCELSERIDAEKGPLLRAVLMHTPRSCMFILSAHHSICDGMSLAFAIRDVLQALSGSSLDKLSLHVSQEDTLGMCLQPRTERNDGAPRAIDATAPSAYGSKSLQGPEVRSLQLSSAFTEALRERARQEGTTVHAALIAAAGVAGRLTPGYCSGRDVHLCSTISNRASMGMPEDSGAFFTACGFAVVDALVTDFWGLARAAKTTLRAAQGEDGVKAVLDAVGDIVRSCADAVSGGEQGARHFQFDIHVSNLGAVRIQTSYGKISLRDLWGPAVLLGFKGEQTLGVSTVNGRLCILHTSNSPLPSFLEHVETILSTACIS